MQGGTDESTESVDPALPSDDGHSVDPPEESAPPAHRRPSSTPQLVLPHVEPKPPPETVTRAAPPTRGAETWYRTDQDRFKSIRRLANPWYRRLARAVIGVCLLAIVGIGLFYGAREVQNYIDRDKLPAAEAETPDFRSTSFEIRSTTPAPILDGTLTLDTSTRAFEFIGRGSGAQAGVQIISEDGSAILIRRGSGPFEAPGAADQLASDVQRSVAYLFDDTSVDAILTTRLRRGYVDLDERTEIGEGDDLLTQYDLRIDTASFDIDFPIQSQEFRDRAIPGVQDVRALPVSVTVDIENVLMGVEDSSANWSWQRLAYSSQPFVPDAGNLTESNTITITDGNIGDG